VRLGATPSSWKGWLFVEGGVCILLLNPKHANHSKQLDDEMRRCLATLFQKKIQKKIQNKLEHTTTKQKQSRNKAEQGGWVQILNKEKEGMNKSVKGNKKKQKEEAGNKKKRPVFKWWLGPPNNRVGFKFAAFFCKFQRRNSSLRSSQKGKCCGVASRAREMTCDAFVASPCLVLFGV
tara:strand:- start:11 stop:544 length:534 start_codon:yes stop_codon:yes gene_type:complete